MMMMMMMMMTTTCRRFDVTGVLPGVSLVWWRLLAGRSRGWHDRHRSFLGIFFSPTLFLRRGDASDGGARSARVWPPLLPTPPSPFWHCAVLPLRLCDGKCIGHWWVAVFLFLPCFPHSCCTGCWGSSGWLCAVSIFWWCMFFRRSFLLSHVSVQLSSTCLVFVVLVDVVVCFPSFFPGSPGTLLLPASLTRVA